MNYSVRWRFVVALLVSLTLHASGAIAWISLRGDERGTLSNADTRVSDPDDEPSFVLADATPPRPAPPPAKEPPTPQIVEAPSITPMPLPKSVTATVTDVGPLTQASSNDLPPLAPNTPIVDVDQSHRPARQGPKRGRILGERKVEESIVFVLDRSASMGPDGLLAKAIDELEASLRSLKPDTKFAVVAYNSSADAIPLRLPTEETLSRTLKWLRSLQPEGSSNHVAGIREALSLQPRLVVLLTDADDLELREAKELAGVIRPPTSIDAVVLGNGRPIQETPLDRLTRVRGGSVRYLPLVGNQP